MSLFGSNTNSAFGGNLGASTTNKPPLTRSLSAGGGGSGSGGLFGNSSTQNASGANSLFGSSNPTNNGSNVGPNSFNTQSTDNKSGGLFGNSQSSNQGSSSGLFGNNNAAKPTNLFGNTQSSNPSSSTGLLGSNSNTSAGTGLFGKAPAPNASNSGSLFGGNTSQPTTTGLFGSSNTSSQTNNNFNGGLFGNAPNNGTSNIFGNKQQFSAAPAPNPSLNLARNPYNYNDSVLNIQNSLSSMPGSITESLFANEKSKESDKTKRFINMDDTRADKQQKSSILSKLGQTFKLIRKSKSSNNFTAFTGLFTQSNYVQPEDKKKIMPHPPSMSLRGGRRLDRSNLDTRALGSIKKLVIKSKPTKYHLINADKILSSKKRNISDEVTLGKLLSDYSSDEEPEDSGLYDKTDGRRTKKFPYASDTLNERTVIEDDKKNALISRRMADADVLPKEHKNFHEQDSEGYWCIPSIEELSSLPSDQLESVENFLIGRVGFGQIAFNIPVDFTAFIKTNSLKDVALKEALFENIVKINSKSVEVYPNGTEKPPVGSGLNVPATISLENIAPKKGVSVTTYIKFLQSQIGMEFVSYNPSTSLWVFKVKHFSIWGLLDENEEEMLTEDNLETKRKKTEGYHDTTFDDSKLRNERSMHELKKQKLDYETQNFPGGWKSTFSIDKSPINSRRDLIADEVDNQIDMYKREKLVNDLTKNTSDITLDTKTDSRSVTPELKENVIEGGFDQQVEYLKDIVNVFPKNTNIEDIIDEKAYEPEISSVFLFDSIRMKPNMPTSDDWLIQLELSNDLNSSLSKFYSDPVPVKKNVSVKQIDNILFPEFNNTFSNGKNSTIDTIQEESDEEMTDNVDTHLHLKTLPKIIYYLLSKDTLYSRENNFPAIKNGSKISFEEISVSYSSEKEEVDEQQLVQLMSILFDMHAVPEDVNSIANGDDSIVTHYKSSIQKSRFLGWLKRFNENEINELLNANSGDILENVFLSVCSCDLKAAIKLCDSTYPHLATILSLLDADDPTVKVVASNQLLAWNEASMNKLIPSRIIDITKILAGDMTNLSKPLPWNVSLALKLKYGDSELDLRQALIDFENFIDERFSVPDIMKVFTLFQEDKNNAFSFIKDSQLSIHIKWLLCKLLSQKNATDAEFDEISSQFGSFLQSKSLWKESIYVYAHLKKDDDTSAAVEQVVKKNIKKIDFDSLQNDEEYLTTVLKVPFSLIYEAVSIHRSHHNDHLGQCEALMLAKMWQQAHEVILYHLGPACVISNSDLSRERLLDIIQGFPDNGSIIPDWNQGAGLYANYFTLDSSENNDALDYLLTNLPLIKTDNSITCKAATKIMSKKVGDQALSIFKDQKYLNQKIFAMPLGENETKYFKTRLQMLS